MPYKLRSAPLVKYGNIQEVMQNKLKRNKYLFRYNPDGSHYYELGEYQLSVEDFESKYPIEIMPLYRKGENSDKTKNWMYNKKSY
jgi:hypothetical protein